ncbi:MAG: hypothetical protein V4519_01700 [Patescibacteria group bacterium]
MLAIDDDIEFIDEAKSIDIDPYGSRNIFARYQIQTPYMTRLLMKSRFVKTTKAAHYILIGIVIACMLFSLITLIIPLIPKKTVSSDVKNKIMEESLRKINQPLPR